MSTPELEIAIATAIEHAKLLLDALVDPYDPMQVSADTAFPGPGLLSANPCEPSDMTEQQRAQLQKQVNAAFQTPEMLAEFEKYGLKSGDPRLGYAQGMLNRSMNADLPFRALGGQESRTGADGSILNNFGAITATNSESLSLQLSEEEIGRLTPKERDRLERKHLAQKLEQLDQKGRSNVDFQRKDASGKGYNLTQALPTAARMPAPGQFRDASESSLLGGSGGVLAEHQQNMSWPMNMNMMLGDLLAEKQIVWATEGEDLSGLSMGDNAGTVERQAYQRGVRTDGTFSYKMLINTLEDQNQHKPNVKAKEIRLLNLMQCTFARVPAGEVNGKPQLQLTVVRPEPSVLAALLTTEQLVKLYAELARFGEMRFPPDQEAAFVEELSRPLSP
jgi:hypothetical protein